MTKKFSFLITLIIMVSFFGPLSICSAHAEGTPSSVIGTVISETTEYFEDGTSLTTIIIDQTTTQARGTTTTKKGTKVAIARNKDGIECCRLTVSGTFSVNMGVSATCTACSHSVSITDTAWSNESASSHCSANQAIGEAKFIRKILFITVETRTIQVTLSCDKNGVLS